MYIQQTVTIVIILFNFISALRTEPKLQLNNFNTLNYNDFKFETLQDNLIKSKRLKRDTETNIVDDLVFTKTRLKFHAFDKYFNIYLKRDLTLVSDSIDIEVRYSYKNKPNFIEHADTYFTNNNYIGYVEGEPKSSVICYLEKADNNTNSDRPLIYAQIRLENNNKREYFYIEPMFLEKNEFDYLIYRSEDIASNVISNGVFNSSVCKPKYATDYENPNLGLSRSKRDAKLIPEKTNEKKMKNRCKIALIADHKFFNNIGNSNIRQTTAYLLNIIGAINSIYTNTVWKFGANVPLIEKSNYGFTVEKVIVLVTPEEAETDHYNTETSSNDADKILQQFSREDFTAYCLAHLFTYKSFDHNVLGLAYVSSPLSYTLGGICSRPTYSQNRMNSLNIGLSSYKSVALHQGRLLQREAELVTAHEFGHNWGSEHDPADSTCSPDSGPHGGNYLMYAYSNQGHDRNNDDFSPCSINSISEVLKTKATCFAPEMKTYCGNGHIENNEECDAGIDTQKDTDPCCNKFCKLRPNSHCSDANHNCCLDCKIARRGYKCWSSPNYLDCFEDHSYCDGVSKDCPVQEPLKAGSDCTSFDFGKCDSTGHCLSICQQKGSAYTSCQCTEKENKCRICCRYSTGNITENCEPFEDVKSKFGPYYLSKGRPCFDGICNEHGVCEAKVRDYVTRFWKVIQTVTVSGFVEFMKRNIVASIIIISLSLWVPFSCCIHFCIDKRNRAMQNQRIQLIHKEILLSRNSGYQSNQPISSNKDKDVTERLLIRTENPERKLSSDYL